MQVIIGPNKKTVVTYMVGELKMLVWFMGTWMLKREYCYDWCLLDVMRIRVKGNDDMIGCTAIVSVSASCSRHLILASSSYCMTRPPYVHWMVSLWILHIYSVEIPLYSLCFTNCHILFPTLKSLSKVQLEL